MLAFDTLCRAGITDSKKWLKRKLQSHPSVLRSHFERGVHVEYEYNRLRAHILKSAIVVGPLPG
jgi:hypothetical protein